MKIGFERTRFCPLVSLGDGFIDGDVFGMAVDVQ
ncbi:Uncharacterised protein [Vibrio cholerae]|nr:Uncharacterised protein [Vibrio cholerae]